MLEGTAVVAALGGVVGAAGTIPYVRDVCRRTTVPHRGTWLIWSVIEVVALQAQRADGASWSTIPLLSQAIGTCVVFALALRFGSGGVSRTELALIALAGAGVLGWFAADEPFIATGGAILADAVGVALMLPKTWHQPRSETGSTFALAALGGALTAGSVGTLSASLLVYPVYFALVNAFVAAVIILRRDVAATPPLRPAEAVEAMAISGAPADPR